MSINNDSLEKLGTIRCRFPKNIIISYININSIRNKLDNLEIMMGELVDVLTISESKLDGTFPTSQFEMQGFKRPYRLDVSDQSGGLLTFVRNDIPSRKLTDFKLPKDIQIIPVELNLRKVKWLLLNIYKHPKQNVSYFLEILSNMIIWYSSYDNIIINGDFNLEPDNPVLSNFLNINALYNHQKEKSCWKSPLGSCIDLIISNRKHSIMNTGTVETGLSDHHLLIYTMLKTTFDKLPPKLIQYRSWKDFDENLFRCELEQKLYNVYDYATFHRIFNNALDRYAPMRTKILRGNNQPHVNKFLRKAIMKRSRLKNIAIKTKSNEDMAAYKKQRNLVVNLNRQAKKDRFANTGTKSRNFWKVTKPYFSSGGSVCREKILLVENGKVVSEDAEIASAFNLYFNRVTDSLEIPEIPESTINNLDPILSIISKYKSHPSILTIKTKYQRKNAFEFHAITEETMLREILSLNPGKSVSGSIPIKALQLAVSECVSVLTEYFNNSIVGTSLFPDELKLADIIPSFKRGSSTDKINYRPIGLLPAVSKVFEKLIAKQLNPFTKTFFSKFLCGFREGLSSQYAILNMLRNWQSYLRTSGKVGAVLMDLSKAFDVLPHDLLLAKLEAYGFGPWSLKLFWNYLNNRKHRVRIGSSISEYLEILLGVPQGSVLGPILFNIFVNDLLLSVTGSSICNFADDNTIYAGDHDITSVVCHLNNDLRTVSDWFSCNGMVANPEKFQFILPGAEANSTHVTIGSVTIPNSNEVKLLGVTIDSQMNFFPHIKNLCTKASSKIKALMRIRKFLTQEQAITLVNAYILSPFNFCPLVWMFCSKQAHNLINSVHYKALCAKFNTFEYNFEQLLQMSDSCTIHDRNLKLLVIEIYKTLHRLNPEIMWGTFKLKPNTYNLRQGHSLVVPIAKSSSATNYFDFRASLAWNHLQSSIKNEKTLIKFKRSLRPHKIYCKCKGCM